MKHLLLTVGLLLGATINAQECSELFISEYVEGWSNNKAIEIYNPTDQSIDLSGYLLQRYSNGSTSASTQNSVQLSGTIEANDVYVAVIDKRDPNGSGQDAPVWDSLQARADGFYCPDYNVSNTIYHNGNDAMVLSKGDMSDVPSNSVEIVDVFGKIGEDPDNGNCNTNDYSTCGWTTEDPYVAPAGVVVTTDHSLIRKPSITEGISNLSNVLSNPFNPLEQWDSIPPVIPMVDANGDTVYQQDGVTPRIEGNWKSLGSHECDCKSNNVNTETLTKVGIHPNPSADGVFQFAGEASITEVVVYNTLGEVILEKNNEQGISSIEIAPNSGVYLVNIRTAKGGVATRRVVIN
ncbi:MAG: lamin tail domain-containing protein [Bacteroidota bacterium]